MDKNILYNMVQYIDRTNRLLAKYASAYRNVSNQAQLYQEKLASSIEELANRGVIPHQYSEAIFNTLKDDPVKTAEFLAEVDNSPVRIGTASDKPNQDSVDDFTAFCLGYK